MVCISNNGIQITCVNKKWCLKSHGAIYICIASAVRANISSGYIVKVLNNVKDA